MADQRRPSQQRNRPSSQQQPMKQHRKNMPPDLRLAAIYGICMAVGLALVVVGMVLVVRIGEEIIESFPNTKMAEEVRGMRTLLESRVMRPSMN